MHTQETCADGDERQQHVGVARVFEMHQLEAQGLLVISTCQ